MVKGTYEHSDTFIQRDVNPVGIYGKVELILTEEGVLEDQTDLKYEWIQMERKQTYMWKLKREV